MTGTVSPEGVPMLVLGVGGRDWPAIVDSGFNGDLELPEALRTVLKPRFRNRVAALLAGGQVIMQDNYTVHIPFDGQMVHAEATFVPEGEILRGTHLMRKHRLGIDFVARTVELQRVSYPTNAATENRRGREGSAAARQARGTHCSEI